MACYSLWNRSGLAWTNSCLSNLRPTYADHGLAFRMARDAGHADEGQHVVQAWDGLLEIHSVGWLAGSPMGRPIPTPLRAPALMSAGGLQLIELQVIVQDLFDFPGAASLRIPWLQDLAHNFCSSLHKSSTVSC